MTRLMKTRSIKATFLPLGMLGALSAPQAALACAMCGLSPGDHAIHAYNASVLFMLSTPYALVLGGGLYFFWAWRNAHRKRKAQGKPASLDLWRRGRTGRDEA